MHRYQVAKYVIFDSEKIFVKKFPWMLKYTPFFILVSGLWTIFRRQVEFRVF
jgi:hypothetical protein